MEAAGGGVARQLPEDGLLSARQRTEHLGASLSVGAVDDLQDAQLGDLADPPHNRLGLLLGQEQMRHEEVRVAGEVAGLPDALHGLSPDGARDIGQDAAAVALALYLAGAMPHARQRCQSALDVAVSRSPALADVGDQGAGVVFQQIRTLVFLSRWSESACHRLSLSSLLKS